MGQTRDLKETRRIIYNEPVLRQWGLAYAEWLVTCIRPPTITERRSKLALLSRRPITTRHLKMLENRKDFQRYVQDLNKGPLEEARAKFAARLPKYADAYEKAIDGLTEQQAWKDVATAVIPALDRIYPKKAETGTAVQVNVTLSPERMAGFADDYQEAEVEVEALPTAQPPSP